MLFSVIVPIYNIEKFLPKCIESILNQTYTNFELILVDDGSTDNSGKICDEYALKDKRIKVIHKKNGGLVSARQEGSKISVGKYIVAVDGDDWIDVQYLENFKETINKTNAEIICCGIKYVINEKQIKYYPYNFKEGYYDKESIKKNIFPYLIRNINGFYLSPTVWGKAFKRELYLPFQEKIDERITISEDACVTYPCISIAKSLYASSKKYYSYRLNQESMTKNKSVGYNWNNLNYIYHCLLNNLNQKEYDFTPQINRYFCHALFNVSISHLKTNKLYKNIKKELINYLSLPQNINFLNSAIFKVFSKDFFVQKIMKYHQIWILKLYVILFRIIKK